MYSQFQYNHSSFNSKNNKKTLIIVEDSHEENATFYKPSLYRYEVFFKNWDYNIKKYLKLSYLNKKYKDSKINIKKIQLYKKN